MNIGEMIEVLTDLVLDKEKAAVIFKTILESNNPDIIQRTLELYTLLILHHGEEIQKGIAEEFDKEESYEQIIRRLEKELHEQRKDRDYYKRQQREKEAAWEYDKIITTMPPHKKWLDIDEDMKKDPPF